MTEVQQISMQDIAQEDGEYVIMGPAAGRPRSNEFSNTPSKSRCSQVITSWWKNSIILWTIALFIVAFGAFSLSIQYAILNKSQAVSDPCSCMVTTDAPTDHAPPIKEGITAQQVQELNNAIIMQTKELLDQMYASFEDHYKCKCHLHNIL